jgi:c(7)-type cytochrome triheme protein
MRRFLPVVLPVIVLLFLLPALSLAVPEGLTLTWTGGGAGAVVFDGTIHAKKGLNCDACHVAGQFHTRKGADPINMDALKKDQYCGTCHNGTKAFGTKDKASCNRCHKKK